MFIATGDTHTHPFRVASRNGGADRRTDGLIAVRQTLEYALADELPWFHGGDHKHVRGTWDQESLRGLLFLYGHDRFKHVPKTMISGNGYHDGTGVKESGGSGLEAFKPYAVVITEPTVFAAGELYELWRRRFGWRANAAWKTRAIAFWPWQPTFERLPAFLEQARDARARLLIAHGFLREALVGKDAKSLPDVGMPMADFGLVGRRPHRVFDCGVFSDVHHCQTLGDPQLRDAAVVYYPGSPYAQSWSEQEEQKGCLRINPDYSSTFLPVRGLPRFSAHQVKTAKQLSVFLERARSGEFKGDFLRLTLPLQLNKDAAGELDACRLFSGARLFEVCPVPPPAASAPQRSDSEELSTAELVDAYLDAVPPPSEAPLDRLRAAMLKLLDA